MTNLLIKSEDIDALLNAMREGRLERYQIEDTIRS